METKTLGIFPVPPALPGGKRREETLRAEDRRRGHSCRTGKRLEVRIDGFFKKKIITIYLHPGPGEGRQEGLVWFYLQGTGEGLGRGKRGEKAETWGRGGARGRRSSGSPHPCLPSLPSP